MEKPYQTIIKAVNLPMESPIIACTKTLSSEEVLPSIWTLVYEEESEKEKNQQGEREP